MAEYIERERLKELLKSHYFPTDQPYESDRNWAVGFNAGLDKAIHKIHYAPAADVAHMARGEWVVCGDGDNVPWMCSHCGKTTAHKYKTMYGKYCPNCGARMDGE